MKEEGDALRQFPGKARWRRWGSKAAAWALVFAFLAPMCSELDAIWSLEESHVLDIESYVKENEFDYIIMEIYPYNINGDAFNFFKGD